MRIRKHPRKVLLAWSGGLDSTYLLQKLLQEGCHVTTVYINLIGNGNKPHVEREVINKLDNVLQELDLYHKHYEVDFTYYYNNCINLAQVVPWLTGLLAYANNNNADEVNIVYVMGDDAISFLTEITKIWNSFSGINGGHIPIKFPLIKHSKKMILNEIHPKLRDLVVWCENPGHNGEHCSECASCKRTVYNGQTDNNPKRNFDNELDESNNQEILKDIYYENW